MIIVSIFILIFFFPIKSHRDVPALGCSRSDKAGHAQWFVLGVGQIIKGLDIGMVDMCPGEKRKITVPPALAFGENGKGESESERGGPTRLIVTC